MAVKVYTDACSNLFKALLTAKGLDIEVFSMELEIDNKSYRCYSEDIDVADMSKDFYREMREGKLPKTSLVGPGVFYEALERETQAGNEVIYISLSSGISGSFQVANMVADEINEKIGKTVIRVIDSKTAGFGEGLIAIKCAKLVKSGMSFDEVYNETVAYVEKVRSEFTVDDLKYLAATGRISKLAAGIANALLIKPLLYGSNTGKIEVTSKAHGRIKAIKALAEQVINHIKNPSKQTVYISHCDAEADALKLKEMLEKNGIENIEIYYYDLISGSHVGPGTLAVFYEGEERAV